MSARRGAISAGVLLAVMAAAGGCGSAPPEPTNRADPTLELFNETARLEFDQERIAESAGSYASALDRAREMDDSAAIASAGYSLAIVRTLLAEYPAALAALNEAGYAADRAKIDLTNISLVRARVELLLDEPAQAWEVGDELLRQHALPAAAAVQAHAIKGLADCRLNRADAAAGELSICRTQAPGLHSLPIDAIVVGLSGEVFLLNKNFAAAAADFDRQADLSRESHDYRTMRHALAKAGEAYARADQPKAGADRLYRAARAAIAAGDPDASRLVGQASAVAAKSQDAVLMQLTRVLLTVPATGPATEPSR